MKKSGLEKISKVAYLILMVSLSYYFLIAKMHHSNPSVFLNEIFLDQLTTKWFVQCPKGAVSRYQCDDDRLTSIELNKKPINANSKSASREIYDWNIKRDKGEATFHLRDDRHDVRSSGVNKKITKIILWILFILTLPPIWQFRDKVISLIKSGWKRI
jgi:hypothetical protein